MDWSDIEEEVSVCFGWFMVWVKLGGVVGIIHESESKKSSDMSGLLAADSAGSAVGDDDDNVELVSGTPREGSSKGELGPNRKARGSTGVGDAVVVT